MPLADVDEVMVLADCFEPPAGFDLEAFARECFSAPTGGADGEVFDVAWRFDPEVAERAATIRFHPGQSSETLADGSLMVRFRAAGLRAMAWYLFTWGSAVEIIEPVDLRTELTRLVIEALKTHGDGASTASAIAGQSPTDGAPVADGETGVDEMNESADLGDRLRLTGDIAASA